MRLLERPLPTPEARDLLDLTRQIAAERCDTQTVNRFEGEARFPREVFDVLGETGLLSLPYPEELGGGGQPFEVYLQVIEELAGAWLAVGLGVSVHVLSCFPMVNYGTPEQQAEWLPRMLGGRTVGAYCLSEPDSGSDAAALRTTAASTETGFVVNGAKGWVTHGGVADYYNLLVRTGGPGARGISCLLAPAGTDGLQAARPEQKMGMAASPTATINLDEVELPASALLGEPGEGFRIAMAALDSGRLGIAACAVGVAQAALDLAADYASTRQQFGRSISEFQGIGFLLADMGASIEAARSLLLDAARAKDAGRDFGAAAAAAKLTATQTAMSVTTEAVQILGGVGYTKEFPVERYMREAKVLQIVEGTTQVQRLVLARALTS